ncbi:hypothetical protein A6J80_11080 [Paracoccus yeei]|uniref:Endonuclease GajA/Old nuclease/RecF-like AAA domain-containing protein n=1 Tax=Paracoccus yeei TaxID=147645 RepID=A0A1V0GSS5_9RHOB|nr:AAA family ATPase [Paracoccus yeei]ARC36850.1 hypothetical protein A6J80_11080 [Paracoccus yeei]
MAQLNAISISRYRSFKDEVRLQLAPLVILIGRNGSGKSVISRLMLLLSEAFHKGRPNEPLNLRAGGIIHALSGRDLPHLKGVLPFSLTLEVTHEEKRLELQYVLRFIPEKHRITIETCILKQADKEIVKISLRNDEQLSVADPEYVVLVNGNPHQLQQFCGLMPIFQDGAPSILKDLFGTIADAVPLVSYLGPFRSETGHFIGSPQYVPQDLGSRGEHTVEILANNVLRGDGRLQASVSKWLEEKMGHRLSLHSEDGFSRIALSQLKADADVSLSETGAGFSQVLPIITQNFMSQMSLSPENFLISEQPELHLHPAAHGDLADLFISTAQNNGRSVLIETHSEQLIMRVRRRIAENVINPEDVVLWSIGHSRQAGESDVRIISLDRTGTPSDWPEGVFEESLQDLTALRSAARERGL